MNHSNNSGTKSSTSFLKILITVHLMLNTMKSGIDLYDRITRIPPTKAQKD